MLPDALAAAGVAGPDVGRLQRLGSLEVGGRTVRLDAVSAPRPGQRVAFVMDTRLCDAVFALADGADLLVVESTFLDEDAALAHAYGHLTARQAAPATWWSRRTSCLCRCRAGCPSERAQLSGSPEP